MLRLSKKVDYAIILLSHLDREDESISAHEMAELYQLPQPMVANILKDLSSSGLVDSIRGKQGGYRLARSAKEISISDVIRIVDSPFSLIECAHDREGCDFSSSCPTRDPLLVLHTELEGFLKSFTLDRIVNHPNYDCCRRSNHEASHLS